FTIREVLKKYDAEVVRFFILRAHYRSPLNYSDKHLDDAKQAHRRMYIALRNFEDNLIDISSTQIDWSNEFATKFKEAMNDDFNTSIAIAVLQGLATEVNTIKSLESAILLKNLGGILGLLQDDPVKFVQGKIIDATINEQANSTDSSDAAIVFSELSIETRIKNRAEAKKSRNFAEADAIRKQLADAGIILEDTPQGTTWRRA
ncbi:MAG: DALR domain-containing protein, partial [Pseudomonadota bacterium]